MNREKRKIKIPPSVLIVFLIISSYSCIPEANTKSEPEAFEQPQQRPIYEPSEYIVPTGYHIEWSDKKIELYQDLESQYQGGGMLVGLNKFFEIIKSPISLYRKGKEIPFEIINIHRQSFEAGLPRFWQPYPDLVGRRLGPKVIREIQQKVGIGNGIQLRMFTPIDSMDFYVSLNIDDPFADYKPVMKVRSNYFSQVFGFQLIQKEDRPAILRLDTTQESTKHVLELYRDNSAYKILHVPDFSTRRRMWRVDLFTSKDIAKTLLVDNPYDLLTLPEYVDYAPRKIVMKWGKMESRLNSENYTYPFFRKNIQKDYQLIVDGKALEIKGVHVVVASTETKPECIITSDLNHPEVVKRLFRLGKGFSVYLDKIVVEDQKGNIFHFPESFAFHIEEGKEFELELSETSPNTSETFEVAPVKSGVRIEMNAIALKDLLSFLLAVEPTDILFNGFEKDLYFDVLFSSNTIGEKRAKELILTKLQHYVRFAMEPLDNQPLLVLKLNDKSLLEKVQHSDEENKYHFSEDKGIKNVQISQVTLAELASLIAYDINIPVADLTNLKGQYDFELTYEDKTDLTKQLQDYGLLLDWYNDDVKIMVSKF